MEKFMEDVRKSGQVFPGAIIKDRTDYLVDHTGLPKSKVVSLVLEDGSRIIIRPSGTEPKLKLYLMVKRRGREEAALVMKELVSQCDLWVETYKNCGHPSCREELV